MALPREYAANAVEGVTTRIVVTGSRPVYQEQCAYRLSVRTMPFQGVKRGSIPRRRTKSITSPSNLDPALPNWREPGCVALRWRSKPSKQIQLGIGAMVA